MTVAEGASSQLIYKQYATGVITSNSEPVMATDPGASGGQILRNVSHNLKMGKDSYQSNERSSTRQIKSMRHGVRRVQGSISGELSPQTYAPLYEALFRCNKQATISRTSAQITNLSADSTVGTLTVGGSTWAAQGFSVGDVVRITTAANAALKFINYTILALAGTVATVYPKPAVTVTNDATAVIARPGIKMFTPMTGHVSRKFAFEAHNADLDISRIYTECRVGSASINMPATGNVTTEIGVMGRNMATLSGGSAPFFTSASAENGGDVCAAVGGVIAVNGSQMGVITSVSMNMTLNPSADPVVGQNIVPEIYLGRLMVTGTITAMLEDFTMLNYFINESEPSVAIQLASGANQAGAFSDCVQLFMPRVKFSDADTPSEGEAGQTISMPFQALVPLSATTGVDQTTITMIDTLAT